MKLTDGEKLITLMLSEIYEKLAINGEIDPDFIKSAIFNDELWGLRWKYPGIPFEDGNDPEIVGVVINILGMWSDIEQSYELLSDEEKKELEEKASPFGKNPEFRGFDGNNETEYMGTAMFIVNDLDRFTEFKGRIFNSHMPTKEAYERMLPVFKKISNETGFPLSVENLSIILSEMIHPENRK